MANVLAANRYANLWSEVDKTLYNQLPIYFAKTQGEYIQEWTRFTKLLNKIKWQANMGRTMRGVRKVPAPILRSQEIPELMNAIPTKDVIEIRETKEEVNVRRKDFESNLFHFEPSFSDFLTNHVDANNEGINKRTFTYLEQFLRAGIFHGSSHVWLCGKASGTELTGVPYWSSPNISLAKSASTLQNLITNAVGPLNLRTISKLATVAYTDLSIPYFSGKPLADGTNGEGAKQKYVLICSSEVWDYFPHDDFLQTVKALDLNVVTGPFTGSLFGKFTTMHERYELRIAGDGTIPGPEEVEENPDAYDYGDTKVASAYKDAGWGVAYLVGAEAYKSIDVSPPPKNWQGTTMKEFSVLDWNGKVTQTDNVLIPGLDQDGNLAYDTNKRGEYLQLIASLAMGLLPIQRRNIIPIIYKRTRVDTSGA